MNLADAIEAVQSKLGVGVDGNAGPETWDAVYRHFFPGVNVNLLLPKPVQVIGGDYLDARSEKHVGGLLPQVRPYARALVQRAAAAGVTLQIISGLRTYAEQNTLYAQGRTAPGERVTNARAGYSSHNFGLAFDVGVFTADQYISESPVYKAVGALGISLGLTWGGDWKTFQDEPHFELRPKWAAQLTEPDMLLALRNRVAQNKEIFA